jgi:predicted O-methyltransferase YrrM
MNKYGKNPSYGIAWKFIRRIRSVGDVEFLRPLYPASTATARIRSDLEKFQSELGAWTEFKRSIALHQESIKADYASLILNPAVWLPLLYFLVRIKQPEIVVETGCATGTTTALILYALEKNQCGHLYSIDLRFPSDWLSQNNLPSGFLVPENLKSRWSLILKDAKTALPELLARLKRVDIFYHDSDHSYVHQMWEYLTALPYVPAGSVLASDDLSDNTAFFDLVRQVDGQWSITRRQYNFGMIVKG